MMLSMSIVSLAANHQKDRLMLAWMSLVRMPSCNVRLCCSATEFCWWISAADVVVAPRMLCLTRTGFISLSVSRNSTAPSWWRRFTCTPTEVAKLRNRSSASAELFSLLMR